MKNIIRSLIILACICSQSAKVKAQRADFSGSWQLNKTKSNFGEQDPDKATPKQLKVKQEAGAIAIEKVIIGSDGQDNSYSETFTFDGKATKKEFATAASKQTRLTTVQWSTDNKTLNISANTDVEINGRKGIYTTEQAWKLSDDGKVLTISNNTVMPDRKITFTAVYDKQ